MSNGQQGVIHSATEGGITGTHPAADPFEFLVAPSTSSEFNTARLRLIPIACWKVEDIRFAFDSSFVTPDITAELEELVALRERHKKTDLLARNVQYPPLSVFGHADPEGSDDYNKALSGRRATVIYGLLISNAEPGKAVSLWSSVARQENWGANHRQAMQSTTGLPAGTPDAQLVHAYLQKLSPKELSLTPKDFLAQGADAGGKGDYQGCSRFNPLLIFSQQKEDEFKQADRDKDQSGVVLRNAANAPNRRVMVLLFRPGSKVDPAKWPCPRATEGIAGCVKRFFSDGQKRRSSRLPETDRKFDDTKDTFACRFYQRISDRSPCERLFRTLRLRLFDRRARPLARAPFVVTVSGRKVSGFTATNGEAVVRDVDLPATCLVQWSRPSAQLDSKPPDPSWRDFEFQHTVFADLDVVGAVPTFADAPLPSGPDSRRLSNMGYIFKDSPEENVRAFQRDAGLAASGVLTDAAPRILEQHDLLVAPPARLPNEDAALDG